MLRLLTRAPGILRRLETRPKHFDALAEHHKQLEVWAEHSPQTFENRAALVAAEIARIEGRILDAQDLYEKAIRSAHRARLCPQRSLRQ